MKKLMLVAALAATACGADDVAIDTGPTPATTDVPTTTAQPTTTVEVTTTTTAVVEPEPVTTVPYVAPVTTRAPRATTTVPYEAVPSPQGRSTRQGGDGPWAIPTYIVMCESMGRWDAVNPSGAAGPYQLMPEHFGGDSALNQSREAQHAKAAELWAGGAGRGNWAECL